MKCQTQALVPKKGITLESKGKEKVQGDKTTQGETSPDQEVEAEADREVDRGKQDVEMEIRREGVEVLGEASLE